MAFLDGAPASASASSSSSSPWRYHVFLSFRGEDTRNNFAAHLYQALKRKGIFTCIDNSLERGEEFSPALFEAIEGSMISIVILTTHYASSTWCLKELMKILECKETNQQKVLPVFYHIDPSDVRYQINSFGKAFAEHEGRFKDDKKNLQRWKAGLTEVSNLSGFHLKKEGNESEFIDQITQWVDNNIIPHTPLRRAKYPVGIESRVEDICSLLCVGMNDVRMTGIVGIGGIGKTTIAKAIYNLIADQFEATCFLPNVRETSAGDCGLVKLQEMLLSRILGGSNLKVDVNDQGINLIKERLCCKKILLILDDVNESEQLKTLVGERNWFGSGSRIIITTRDRDLLTKHDVDFIYEVQILNREESLQLFSWSAFKGPNPPVAKYGELVEQVTQYVRGLPLALQVLGSGLYGKSIDEWMSVINDCKEGYREDIQKVLRSTYEGLDQNEKNIFLDIACFFRGEKKNDVIKILDNCGFYADIGIRRLMEKHLIVTTTHWSSDELILEMHDLLQEMGREIVREESPEEPGGRSRLWSCEDLCRVQEENTGTNEIEAILVDLPRGVQLNPKAFMKMKRLRLFINRNARFSGEIHYLPDELRVLDWPGCHLPALPSNFHGKKLSYLNMSRSRIQDVRVLEHMNLTVLDLSNCGCLTEIPDLSRHPNLKELTLSHCKNLEKIHDSVGLLDKLIRLDLKHCPKLRSFPRSIKLKSLEVLDLEGCSSLRYFPEIDGEMKNLAEISLYGSDIIELPSSIKNISGLRDLRIQECRNLTQLPGSILQLLHLESLSIVKCPRFDGKKLMEDDREFMASIVSDKEYEISGSPPTNSSISNDDCYKEPAVRSSEFLSLENLVLSKSNCFMNSTWQPTLSNLDLSGSGIVSLPGSIKIFARLRSLYLNNCEQLQEILELPQNIEEVVARGCISLESFPQVSKKFQFDTSEDSLDKLDWLDLWGCRKMLEKLRNPVLSPTLRTDLLGPVYAGQEIPTSWISFLEDYILDGIEDSRRGLPTWFSHSENFLNTNRCRINVNGQECLEGAITIALCAVIVFLRPQVIGKISAFALVVREGCPLRHVEGTTALIGNESRSGSQHLFVAYTRVQPSELEGNHLEVEFSASSLDGPIEIASCEVHRADEHKKRAEARKRKNEYKEKARAKDGPGVLPSVPQMDVSSTEPENLLDLLNMIQHYQSSRKGQLGKQLSGQLGKQPRPLMPWH